MVGKKPFLPSPRYKPLAFGVFCFLGAAVAFFPFYFAQQAGSTLLMTIFGSIYVAGFFGAIAGWFRFAWVMFVKGGWREEQARRMAIDQGKQPWE
jgi:VIT1/CCC1 family predicted Fe2+/Mn2+ transporter